MNKKQKKVDPDVFHQGDDYSVAQKQEKRDRLILTWLSLMGPGALLKSAIREDKRQ